VKAGSLPTSNQDPAATELTSTRLKCNFEWRIPALFVALYGERSLEYQIPAAFAVLCGKTQPGVPGAGYCTRTYLLLMKRLLELH
jgi:hypothetical protein